MTRILIVEDDRATSGLLKTVFEMEGFKVTTCPAADRVLEVVRQVKPDLILMDYYLADMESLPVFKEIKADEELATIAVVMTSGLDRSEQCKQSGADSFLLKPFRPSGLLAEVRTLLGNPSP